VYRSVILAARELSVPNKTIYVSDDDLPLYRRAQEMAGGSLSAAITAALKRFVDVADGQEEGYDEITVKVGRGGGRKQRFSGILLGEWGHSTSSKVEVFKVYKSRTGKFVVHVMRSQDWSDASGSTDYSSGWRSWVGNWSANQTWTSTPAEATLTIVDSLPELRDMIPPQLYDVVADSAEQPAVEDLGI